MAWCYKHVAAVSSSHSHFVSARAAASRLARAVRAALSIAYFGAARVAVM
jgi:hypothetical protein